MKDRDIMEMLSDDISAIELPPISDKVLRALHEKKEKISEKTVHHTASAIKHKHFLIKLVFAAMLAFFVFTVPIIIAITNNHSVVTTSGTDSSIGSSDSVSADEPSAFNSYVNPEKKTSALDIITERKTYGPVCLTNKSSKELESLLSTFNNETQVYEDDSYIYNFDTEGNLIELMNKAPVEENGIAVSEEDIKEKINADLHKYIYDFQDDSHEIKIQQNHNAYPAWTVIITNKESVLSGKILITYDSDGSLRRMIISGIKNDIGAISRAEAIQIAINEIKSGKYDIPEFDEHDVSITIEKGSGACQSEYFVFIGGIRFDNGTIMGVNVHVDSNTGKVISIDY